MKKAHVVGNGPSYINFQRTNEEDLVVGCNITRIDADLTTLSDLRLAYRIRESMREKNQRLVNCPVLVNKKIYNWLQTDKGKQCELDVKDVYNTYDYQPIDLSSGHYAAMWLLEQGYDDIHVWGVDSYWDNHIRSYTDEIVDHSVKTSKALMAEVALRWKAKWDELGVTIHAPIT